MDIFHDIGYFMRLRKVSVILFLHVSVQLDNRMYKMIISQTLYIWPMTIEINVTQATFNQRYRYAVFSFRIDVGSVFQAYLNNLKELWN